MHPQLKVEINKDFDKEICLMFLNQKKAGIDFGEGVIKVHPQLKGIMKKSLDKQKELISEYFDSFYQEHTMEIESTLDKYTDDWGKIQSKFFKVCGKYFDNMTWSTGQNVAFISIINCNPRFLDQKMFQVYWKNEKGFVPVAAHETLHFLFYHFISLNFPFIDINSNEVWKLSEVFNILLLREPDFIEITKDLNPDQYPELATLQSKLVPIWEKTKNAKKFLDKVLEQ